MRKQELVHIHALLASIRREFDDLDVPPGAFEAYESHDVHPVAIYGRKDAHEEAIGHLLSGIETTLEQHDRARDSSAPEEDRSERPDDAPIPR